MEQVQTIEKFESEAVKGESMILAGAGALVKLSQSLSVFLF